MKKSYSQESDSGCIQCSINSTHYFVDFSNLMFPDRLEAKSVVREKWVQPILLIFTISSNYSAVEVKVEYFSSAERCSVSLFLVTGMPLSSSATL